MILLSYVIWVILSNYHIHEDYMNMVITQNYPYYIRHYVEWFDSDSDSLLSLCPSAHQKSYIHIYNYIHIHVTILWASDIVYKHLPMKSSIWNQIWKFIQITNCLEIKIYYVSKLHRLFEAKYKNLPRLQIVLTL